MDGFWIDTGSLRLVCDTVALLRAVAGMHFNVGMLRENIRPVDQEKETVSFCRLRPTN